MFRLIDHRTESFCHRCENLEWRNLDLETYDTLSAQHRSKIVTDVWNALVLQNDSIFQSPPG
jgi:hypothetical protein